MDERTAPPERGELVDMQGRRLKTPSFPRLSRQTPLQRQFLRRLERLVLLSRYGQRHLAFSDQEGALMRKAIYSVFLDCRALGVGAEASAILARRLPTS
jgi:hypothetical protein